MRVSTGRLVDVIWCLIEQGSVFDNSLSPKLLRFSSLCAVREYFRGGGDGGKTENLSSCS